MLGWLVSFLGRGRGKAARRQGGIVVECTWVLFFVIDLVLARTIWLAGLVLVHGKAISDQDWLTCLRRIALAILRANILVSFLLLWVHGLLLSPCLFLAVDVVLIFFTVSELFHDFHLVGGLLVRLFAQVACAAAFGLLLSAILEVLIDIPGLSTGVAARAVAVSCGAEERLGLGLGGDGGQSGWNRRETGIDGVRSIAFLQQFLILRWLGSIQSLVFLFLLRCG